MRTLMCYNCLLKFCSFHCWSINVSCVAKPTMNSMNCPYDRCLRDKKTIILGDNVPWCFYQLSIYFYYPKNTSMYILYIYFI